MSKVKLEWFGHSYVRLTFENKIKIVIDPHDGGSLNLPEYRVDADIVLITHNHYDHNAVEMINGNPLTLRSFRGNKKVDNISITGLKSYHDKAKGKIRGENTIYIINYEKLRIVHMGDIGHKPDASTLEILKNTDILMIPVGGVYTIDAYEAWEVIEEINPKIILPIHFWIPYSTVPLDPLDKFLAIAKTGRTRLNKNLLEIDEKTLSKIKRTLVVMPLHA